MGLYVVSFAHMTVVRADSPGHAIKLASEEIAEITATELDDIEFRVNHVPIEKLPDLPEGWKADSIPWGLSAPNDLQESIAQILATEENERQRRAAEGGL